MSNSGNPVSSKAGTNALLRATASLGQSRDLDALLRLVMEQARELMQADRSTLFMLSKETGELWSKVATADGETLMEIRIPANRGIAGYVVSTGQALNIPDAYKDSRFDPTIDQRTGYVTRNILCLPVLNSANDLIGVIQLINKHQGHFTSSDEELMRAFNIQAGMALENALERQLIADANNEQQVSPVSIGISDEKQLKSTNDNAISFPSLSSLRSAHSELLKRHRESGSTTELLAEMEEFICRGRATGALLDTDEDRWASQSLLDYWSAILYRAGHEPPDATLAEFDPALAPELDDARCPYLGLEAFREEKSNLFYGRQRLLEKLVNHLKKNRLLAVVGSSGSGKSSVVLGGLLPKLKVGALSGSENWHYYSPMVPGVNPLENLARLTQPRDINATEWLQQQFESFQKDPNHLTKLSNEFGNRPCVLVVDQFEEVFTLCREDNVRQAFIDNLISLIQSPGVRHTVILTMRTDFESQVARVPVFKDLFEQAQVRVTALDASELREAIEKPAELVGLKFEEGLVEALLQDVLGEPAALPLLQFTLLKLWDNRERNRVTWETYKRLGGGRQALARSADEFYEQLIPEEQVTVKRILLRMVRPTEGLEVTSNRIQRKTLYQAGEARDRVERVLNKLIQAQLVRLTEDETPEDDQIEVAHEALVRNWPRLVDWLDDERVARRNRLRLTSAAEQWKEKGKDRKALLRGSLLDEARCYEDLNQLETEFIQQSIRAEREDSRVAWAIRAILVLTISLVGTTISFFNFYNKEQRTNQQLLNILNLFQGVDTTSNLLTLDAKTGLASAIAATGESLKLGNVLSPVENNLRRALSTVFFRSAVFVAYTADNKHLVSVSQDHTALVWDLTNGKKPLPDVPLGQVQSDIISIAFSTNSQFIFTASKNGYWQLWNRQGKLLQKSSINRDFITSVAFSNLSLKDKLLLVARETER